MLALGRTVRFAAERGRAVDGEADGDAMLHAAARVVAGPVEALRFE